MRQNAMTITPTELRKDLYNLLDQVARTGRPLEIRRKGQLLKIVATPPAGKSKLANLKTRKTLLCPPEEIVHLDWSQEIKLDLP